jgi:DNA-binding NtrC family response regulator
MPTFAEELHAEITEVEEKIKGFFEKFEGEGKKDEKAVLADAKTDAEALHAQVDAEKPEVEADASETLKTAVSDLQGKVLDVVEHPTDAPEDLAEVGKELEGQEQPEIDKIESDAKTDAETDKNTVDDEIKAILDNNAKIAEDSKNVPEPVEGAETPETFANRIPDHRTGVAGTVHQV